MPADVESQSSGARPRGRCLDTFLTVSVIALFIMFLVALGGALLVTKHLEREMNARMRHKTAGGTEALVGSRTSAEPGASYKVQNFAYLRATRSKLEEGVMEWETIAYGEGESIGSLYRYGKHQRVLTVLSGGSYFLYVQLTFSCTFVCPSARYTVSFYDQRERRLTCTVELPAYNQTQSQPVSRTCWRVLALLSKESRLLAKAQVSEQWTHWKLELNDSGFGMFLVDR